MVEGEVWYKYSVFPDFGGGRSRDYQALKRLRYEEESSHFLRDLKGTVLRYLYSRTKVILRMRFCLLASHICSRRLQPTYNLNVPLDDYL